MIKKILIMTMMALSLTARAQNANVGVTRAEVSLVWHIELGRKGFLL